MLAVQVQYWDLKERSRHNLVTERQNDRNLQIAAGELAVHQGQLEETKRHNLATENVSILTLNETKRHNIATEAISSEANNINAYNADTNRMNAATNAAMVAVSWYNAETGRRSQIAQAHYNNAHIGVANRQASAQEQQNIIRAQEIGYNYEIGSRQAAVSERNADTNYYNLMEYVRHNQATEEVANKQVLIEQQKVQIEKGKLVNDVVQDTWRNLNESIKISEQNKPKTKWQSQR